MKVIQKVSLFLIVVAVGVLCEKCKHQHELWSETEDLTKYSFCNKENKSEEAQCETGRGFMKTETVSGCVPWEDWDSICIPKENQTKKECTGDNVITPWADTDPTKFHFCPGPKLAPVKANCSEGTAFFKNGGYLGCFKWAEWKNLKTNSTKCELFKKN